MYVCVYVRTYLFMCMYVYVFIYLCMCVCMYLCMYVCMNMIMYMNICIYPIAAVISTINLSPSYYNNHLYSSPTIILSFYLTSLSSFHTTVLTHPTPILLCIVTIVTIHTYLQTTRLCW
jgi:hypothetical protein